MLPCQTVDCCTNVSLPIVIVVIQSKTRLSLHRLLSSKANYNRMQILRYVTIQRPRYVKYLAKTLRRIGQKLASNNKIIFQIVRK